ncbi:hypothetical protein [Agrococcus beijingensis]|uniref:hypothetical protein n=1 Tax=Agrococcus beijingensis TaxID=3068634 RepID=UPI00274130C8|nr:hypothetical protein [Agrococcus sp. REN33]
MPDEAPLATPLPVPTEEPETDANLEPRLTKGAEVMAPAALSIQAAPAAALPCVAGTFFSVSSSGLLQQVQRGTSNNSGIVTAVGAAPNGWGIVSPNFADGLGVSAGGAQARAFEVNATGIANLLTYDAAAGVFSKTPAPLTDGNDYRLSAGAVNPFSGSYFIGGFDLVEGSLRFELTMVNTDNTYTYVGYIPIDSIDGAAGDIAFDAAGNLYLIAGTNKPTAYSVTASQLASAAAAGRSGAPGLIGHNVLASGLNGMTSTAGMAFDADGSVYLARTTEQAYRYNPSTWVQYSDMVSNKLSSPTDLASCSSPSTISIVKNVVGRVASSDQFSLTLEGSGAPARTVTTSGSVTGPQAAQLGPAAVVAGVPYRFSETMAGGAAVTRYASGYACVGTDGSRIAGNGPSGSLTPASGVSYVCTFTNSPLITAVSIHKTLVDVAGNRTNGADWPLGASIAATSGGGSASLTPVGTAGVAGPDGTARWNLAFPTTVTRVELRISEGEKTDYRFTSGYCDVTTVNGTTSRTAISSTVTLTLKDVAPGSVVACEYVNTQPATTLTLRSAISFGDQSLLGSWDLSATAQTTPATVGPVGKAGVSGQITPGAGYLLRASGGDAAYVSTGWSCLRGTDALPVIGDVVTASLGDSIICTVTLSTAMLTLLKHIDGSVPATIESADFTLTLTPATLPGLADVSFPGSELPVASGVGANTFAVRPAHAYTLSETSRLAYLGVALQRYNAPYPTNGVFEERLWVTQAPATVQVAAGLHVAYRFVNMPVPVLTLPLTGGVGADAYVFGGAALLALAAVLLAVQARSSSSRRLSGRLT